MKIKKIFLSSCVLYSALCALCRAEVKYIIAKDGSPSAEETEQIKHVYIYGGYNFHFPNNLTNNAESVKNDGGVGSLAAGLGFRWTTGFRTELSYEHLIDKYSRGAEKVKSDGYAGFVNFIFDAKIPPEYQLFRTNPFVPFVGFGAGFVYDRTAELGGRNAAAYNFIGGMSAELNRTLALQLTYKYIKLLRNSLTIDGVTARDFAPSSHNFGVALRMNF